MADDVKCMMFASLFSPLELPEIGLHIRTEAFRSRQTPILGVFLDLKGELNNRHRQFEFKRPTIRVSVVF